MTIYERWVSQAYDRLGQTVPAHWNTYLPKEQKIYEDLLENKRTVMSGTLAELSNKYDMTPECFLGFVDGINDALDKPFEAEEVQAFEELTHINISFKFETLYKKMVEYKADHLYELPQWDFVFTPERRSELYVEQKRSTIVRKDPVPGRNESCTCGSGKKYKKCCGA